MRAFRQPLRRLNLTSLLLVALMFRSLIPSGFMPSAERLFVLELCPATFPAHLLPAAHGAHAGHDQRHSHGTAGDHSARVDYCSFGSAPGAAPVAQWNFTAAFIAAGADRLPEFGPAIRESRLLRAQQARAPPAFS